MKKKNSNHFYASYLISEKEFNPKRAELILKLIDKKVFQPVNLKQIKKDELILDI